MKKIIIAIDGHSSCGKSTVAKAIAKKLGYKYIDSGAMYRAVTLYCLQHNIISQNSINEELLKNSINNIKIDFVFNSEIQKIETFLNGKNVENEIRNIEVANNVSNVSKIGFVRHRMVQLQQQMGEEKGIVMDGRDIGTVVFPNAELKIFMTADAEVRAQRRFKELIAKGEKVSYEEIVANIKNRDFTDENRKESPLRKADDAIILDNSNLTQEEQLEWIVNIVKTKELNF